MKHFSGALSSTADLGPELNRTIWLLAGLATLFLGLRIFCKVSCSRSLWWDDYFLIASWVALIFSNSVQSASVELGFGRHNQDILPHNFRKVIVLNYIAGFGSILAAVWSKTSFSLTLLRISRGSWIRGCVWFILVTVNLVMGASAALQFLQCWPVNKLWDITVQGRCLPSSVMRQYGLFMSAYSGVMDIVLALLPWPLIWNSQLSKREKYGALFAMSMGIFAGVSSLLKISALFAIGNPDIATNVTLFIFGTAEGAVTIMAASIPILRALMRPGVFRRGRSLRQEPVSQSRDSQDSQDTPNWPDAHQSERSIQKELELENGH